MEASLDSLAAPKDPGGIRFIEKIAAEGSENDLKSRFFTDTQGLDTAPVACDKVSVCLLLNRRAYEWLLIEAQRSHMTSGEYIDRLIGKHMKPGPM